MKRKNNPDRKEKRQEEAIKRQKQYNKLTIEQKIASAIYSPGHKRKELHTLDPIRY